MELETSGVIDNRTRRDIIRNKQKRCLLLLLLHRRRRKRLGRKVWVLHVNQMRETQSEYNGLLQELRLNDHETFVNFNRMTPNQFDTLLNLISPIIQRQTTMLRDPISPGERLAITLRYLATGESQRTVSRSFRVGQSTASAIVRDTCEAIWTVLQPLVLKTQSQFDHEEVADKFFELRDYPNCLGAMAVVRVGVKPSCSVRSGREPLHVFFASICDTDYQFTLVHVDEHKRADDIFSTSNLGHLIQSGSTHFPSPRPLPGYDCDKPMPFVFVGDKGLPLKDYLMSAYPRKNDKNIFNYRTERVVNVSRNTLGIMTSRWKIFRCNIVAKQDKVVRIVKAACCLHNFLLQQDDDVDEEIKYNPPGYVDQEDQSGNKVPGLWRSASDTNCLNEIDDMSKDDLDASSIRIRETFKEYFASAVGEIPQQYKKKTTL